MRRPATLCAVLTFGLLAQFAPLAPARAVDGALDPTFGTLGMTRSFFDLGTTDEDRGYDVAIDALDRIVVVGIVDVAGVKHWGVTRLLPNGALETSFSVGGDPGDGKLVLDTYVADPAHPPVVAVWDRLDDDPDLRNDIVIAGRAGGNAAYCAVNAEGSSFACAQDATFISYWYADIELRGSSIYLGGTIVGSGTNRNFFIERHSTTAFPWPLDGSFGSGGVGIFNYDVPGGTVRMMVSALACACDSAGAASAADAAPIECESVREGKPNEFETATKLPPPPLVVTPPPDRKPPRTKIRSVWCLRRLWLARRRRSTRFLFRWAARSRTPTSLRLE